MFTFSATRALLPLEQHLTVLKHTVPVFMSFQGTESTKLCSSSVYLRTCATELQNSSFSNPASTSPPPLRSGPHYHQQPSIWPCVSVPHFLVSVCAPAVCAVTFLCRELWENIFYELHALRGMEPSKNKWMACFSDLRTMKSPPFALSLT